VLRELTDEQRLLHDGTARFIESELPLSATRRLHDDPVGYDGTWLRKSAELGWYAMLVPEADGGGSVSGAPMLDALVVAIELGRSVQPGPFLGMNVVAREITRGGTPNLRALVLPGLTAGEMVATWAPWSAAGMWDAGAGVAIERVQGAFALRGVRGFVQDAVSADWLLVVATLEGMPVQALVPRTAAGVEVRPRTCLDLSRRLADVEFDGVAVTDDAIVGRGADALESALVTAVVLTCADTFGAMERLLAMTVDYANARVAFGRPVGSFQAIKHVLADQALALRSCEAVLLAAAEAADAGADDAGEVASMAAAYVGDTGNELAQQCLQVHGGIGYTWEHDLHLLLRRIRSNTALAGLPAWHRERVCAFHDRLDR
jgi:alkylation response protein AidB-like acyl-CoA dehydrogenase